MGTLGGLRLKEALILSWDRSATISVFTDGEYLAYRFYAEGQKGHRDELLPMTPDFARFLLKTPPEMRHSLVFGMRLTEEYVGHVITKIGRRAKVIVSDDGKKCASAHDLRRTFGTRWATRVAPVELQRLMRHRSLDTTLKYYVLINSDALAKKLWASEGGELGGFAKKHQVAKEP